MSCSDRTLLLCCILADRAGRLLVLYRLDSSTHLTRRRHCSSNRRSPARTSACSGVWGGRQEGRWAGLEGLEQGKQWLAEFTSLCNLLTNVSLEKALGLILKGMRWLLALVTRGLSRRMGLLPLPFLMLPDLQLVSAPLLSLCLLVLLYVLLCPSLELTLCSLALRLLGVLLPLHMQLHVFQHRGSLTPLRLNSCGRSILILLAFFLGVLLEAGIFMICLPRQLSASLRFVWFESAG